MSAYNCNVDPISNTAGVNAYVLTADQVNSFLSYIWSDTFWEHLGRLFSDPVEGIISLKMFPYTFFTGPIQPEPIKIGNLTAPGEVSGYRARGANPNMANFDLYANVVLRLGSIAIEPRFYNYMDYSPYTQIDLWLPYIGFTPLDVDLVMGKNIAVDYAIDIVTGDCSAFVKIVETVDPRPVGFEALNGEIIQTLNGRMGLEIPVNASNRNDIAKNVLATGFSLAGGAVVAAATGGVGAGVAAGLVTGTVTNTLTGMQMHVQKGQLGNGFAFWTAPQVPYLIISRPIPDEPSYYAHTFGRPSARGATLGNLTGFTKVNDVHLEGFGTATTDELAEIEAALREGVIL